MESITPSSFVVLVTGANGFIASWIVYILLNRGYKVRGTVRNAKNKEKHAHLLNLPGASERLELVEFDILNTSVEDLSKYVEGCTYIIHTASPVEISGLSKKEEESKIVQPAIEGTLKILRAAQSVGGIKRIVYTTSLVAFRGVFESNAKLLDKHVTEHPRPWIWITNCWPCSAEFGFIVRDLA